MLRRLPLLFALLLLAAPPLKAQEGPGLVTVIGAIETSNRGPFDSFSDALLETLTEPFETAYVFDWAALAALPQESRKLAYENWKGRDHTLSGPRLDALLAAVGATGDSVTVTALDGYAATFTRAEIASSGMLLAIRMDGQPLALGGRGPAWLALPPGSLPSLGDGKSDSGLVWAVVLITVD